MALETGGERRPYPAVRLFLLLAGLLGVVRLVAVTGIIPFPLLGNPWNPASGFGAQAFFVGTVIIFFASRPSRRDGVVTLLAGAASALFVIARPRALPVGDPLPAAIWGLAVGSVVASTWRLVAARGRSARLEALDALLALFLLPLFFVLTGPFLSLTAALRPTTLDAQVFAVDATFGLQPSFALPRLILAVPWLKTALAYSYNSLPIALALCYGLRSRRRPDAAAFNVFVALGAAGWLLYLAFPVVGPAVAFWSAADRMAAPLATVPDGFLSMPPPPPDRVLAAHAVTRHPLVPRNCMPSLHLAWALAIAWLARGTTRWFRVGAGAFAVVMAVNTVGLGYHYLSDLVAAVPLTLAVVAAMAGGGTRDARRALGASTVLLAAWLLLIGRGASLSLSAPFLFPLVASAIVAVSFVLAARLPLAADGPAAGRGGASGAGAGAGVLTRPDLAILAAVFTLSGFAGLVYQIVFAKGLALTFGSTSHAQTTVLATFMGGLALGTWAGGRLAPRLRDCARAYALAEGGIGLFCVAAPWLLSVVRWLYTTFARGSEPAEGWLIGLQLVLGSFVLLPPTFLMGLTTPLLVRRFLGGREELGRVVGLLYAVNTLGAALGALLAGYLLVPTLGVRGALAVAILTNLLVAVLVFVLGARYRGERTAPAVADAPEAGPAVAGREARTLGRAAIVILAVGGFVTFGLELTYVHLLAVVVGNSAYAFALMLFTFLAGLTAGAAAARAVLRANPPLALLLVLAQAILAATVLLGAYLWNAVPGYFASFAAYELTRSFGAREFVRFVVCLVALGPPAFVIGLAYPFAIEAVGRAHPGREVEAMGRASALNTLGNILGAVTTGFLLLPALGSLRTLHLVSGLSLLLSLAALPFVTGAGNRLRGAAAAAAALALLVTQPSSFDLTRLSTGANVYFEPQFYGTVVDHAESLDGGLTSVVEARPRGAERVLTLLTNGKFQGDDSRSGEMVAQSSFGLVPLLHDDRRGRALVIGLGTGVSARVLSDAGFAELEIAELSGDIVRMARAHFASVNAGVLDRPSVRVHVTDGRNFLLLEERSYDVISLEISSIWFAGASTLYNKEFYQLVRSRLAPGGVLQQWVQLHRISPLDIASVLASVRSQFRYVWLYYVGQQGIIVAAEHDARPSRRTLERLESDPGLAEIRALHGGSFAGLLRSRVLSPEATDRLLATIAGGPDFLPLVSTDDNLFLEYSTPRGNVRRFGESLRQNVAWLMRFRPADLLEATDLGADDLGPAAHPQAGR